MRRTDRRPTAASRSTATRSTTASDRTGAPAAAVLTSLLLGLAGLLGSLALVALGGLAASPAAAAEAMAPAGDAAVRLDALAEEYWQHVLARSAALRLKEGLPVEELPSLSYDEAKQDAAWARGLLDRLDTIDIDRFDGPPEAGDGDHERWLTAKILRWELDQVVEAPTVFWYSFQVTPYAWAFSGVGQTLAQVPVATPEDRQRYLHLLDQLPDIAETLRANLETQRRMGILVPRPEIDLVVATLSALAPHEAGDQAPHEAEKGGAPSDPTAHPFHVASARLAGVDPEEAKAFESEVDRRIAGQIAPAFGRLVAIFGDDYRAAAPEAVGLGQYPGGAEAYRTLVRLRTGLDLSPGEIHRRGLAEVERIEGEMATIRKLLGSDASMADFNAMLRTDPRFLACDPAGVAERLNRPIRRIEPLIGRWFLHTPKAPYGVGRLDPALEPGMTYGYYQWPTPGQERGLYYFNGSKLDQRSLVQAAALIYHELVPGHHFQIALQNENHDLPAFRRSSFPTAFVEGWAEYASGLAGEMGLYAEPYDHYGRLAMDMFLSCRLVVDTGMNVLGWSREKALDYMGQRVLESSTQLATETLRYSTDIPAQALGYKLGSATIWRLRHRAEEALGDRFDVRRFHDAVIGHGAMPLAVLEEHIDWWIGQEQARRDAAAE